MSRNNRVTVSVETITPEIAEILLESTPPESQRALDNHQVAFLCEELRSGRFVLNGESIILNGSRILDGQHRLEACRLTRISFESIVVRNIDHAVFPTIDAGKRRGASDVLKISGRPNAGKWAAACRYLYYESKGLLGTKSVTVSNEAILEIAERHPRMQDSIDATNGPLSRLLPPGLATFLHYRFTEVDPAHAAPFFESLGTGEALSSTDPVYWLRKRLVDNRIARAKLSPVDLAALTIKAFKLYRVGGTARLMRWRRNEEFPSMPR